MESQLPWRLRLGRYLDDFDSGTGRLLNLALCGLIFISSGIFVAQTYPLPTVWAQYLDYLDTGILILFAVEYCCCCVGAAEPRKFIFSFFPTLICWRSPRYFSASSTFVLCGCSAGFDYYA